MPPPASTTRHECPTCHRCLASRHRLKTHLLTHLPPSERCRPFACTFDGCNSAFFSRQDRERHLESCHGNSDGRFQCHLCGKCFHRCSVLKRHIAAADKKGSCDLLLPANRCRRRNEHDSQGSSDGNGDRTCNDQSNLNESTSSNIEVAFVDPERSLTSRERDELIDEDGHYNEQLIATLLDIDRGQPNRKIINEVLFRIVEECHDDWKRPCWQEEEDYWMEDVHEEEGTEMCCAAEKVSRPIVLKLLEAGAEPNFISLMCRRSKALPMLCISLRTSHWSIARLLIRMGALVHQRSPFGKSWHWHPNHSSSWSPFQMVCNKGVPKDIREAVFSSACDHIDINQALMIAAVKPYNISIASQLIELKRADPTYMCRGTALHVACWFNNLEMVEKLLESGANPNARDDFLDTPVHDLLSSPEFYEDCRNIGLYILNSMIRRDAEVNAINAIGETPLHCLLRPSAQAHSVGELSAAFFLLLDSGAKVNITDAYGLTPLYYITYWIPDHGIDVKALLGIMIELTSSGANGIMEGISRKDPVEILEKGITKCLEQRTHLRGAILEYYRAAYQIIGKPVYPREMMTSDQTDQVRSTRSSNIDSYTRSAIAERIESLLVKNSIYLDPKYVGEIRYETSNRYFV